MKYLMILFLAFLFITGMALAKGNNKYFISIPHSQEDCMRAKDDFNDKSKLLAKTEWGCMSGDHTAYLFVVAKNETEAKNMLPESMRDIAKIVKVNKFTTKQIESMHKDK